MITNLVNAAACERLCTNRKLAVLAPRYDYRGALNARELRACSEQATRSQRIHQICTHP